MKKIATALLLIPWICLGAFSQEESTKFRYESVEEFEEYLMSVDDSLFSDDFFDFDYLNSLVTSDKAIPIISVPPLPQGDRFEIYEDTEELYVMKLMEYVQYAIILKTQYDIMKSEESDNPQSYRMYPLETPSYEEITDMELSTIVRYRDTAVAYENRIRQMDVQEHYRLVENIQALKSKLSLVRLRLTRFLGSFKSYISYRIMTAINERDSLCSKQTDRILSQYQNKCKDCVPILSIALTADFFNPFNGTDSAGSKASPGFKVNFNTIKILGHENLELWYQYHDPIFWTRYPRALRWNSSIHAVGIQWNLTRALMHTSAFNSHYREEDDWGASFKFGGGYFWGSSKIYNSSSIYGFTPNDIHWSGFLANLELSLGKPSWVVPFELVATSNLYISNNDDLILTNNPVRNPAEIVNVNLNSFQWNAGIGVKITIWRSPEHVYGK